MRVLPLAAAVLLAGCVTTSFGRKFDMETVKTFEAGKTTQDDVLAELGEPFSRSFESTTKREMWTYYHMESTARAHPASFVVPFYTRVDSQGTTTMVTLAWDGNVLAEILHSMEGGGPGQTITNP